MLNSEFIMLNYRSRHAEETDFKRNPKKLPKEKSNGDKKLNSNMKTKNRNLTTLDEILDTKYGEKGEEKREQWEQEFEAFKLGVLLEEARNKSNETRK